MSAESGLVNIYSN